MKDTIHYIEQQASEREYHEGLKLLSKYNIAPIWQEVLQKLGESDYTRGILLREISTYCQAQKDLKSNPKVLFEPDKHLDSKSEASDAPALIKEAIENRKRLFKESNRMHFELVLHAEKYVMKKDTLSDEEAKKAVFELRKNLLEADQYWEITNTYDKSGIIIQKPTKVKIKLKAGESLERRLRTVKTYLSPSYLRKIPNDRLQEHISNTRAEILIIETALTEQNDLFNYEQLI